MARLAPRVRAVLVVVALAALLAAPATWAAETLGHATNGTFPTGGPATASLDGGPRGLGRPGVARPGLGGPPGVAPGPVGATAPGFGGPGGPAGPGGGGPGGFGGNSSTLTAAVRYAAAHGGGTLAVSSQSSAAAAILTSGADVAGLGGFSGRESSVSVSWLAAEVRSGHVRWVIADTTSGAGLSGDTRQGSKAAISVVSRVCRAVTLTTGTTGATARATAASAGTGTSSTVSSTVTMYDCLGRSAALLKASSV